MLDEKGTRGRMKAGNHNLRDGLGTQFSNQVGLANMGKYFFCNKNTVNNFFMTKWHILIYFLIVQASYEETRPLTGRLGLSQGSLASHKEAGPLTGRPSLSQGGQASHRKAQPLTGRPVSHRDTEPLTGWPGLSEGGRASYKKLGLS